MTTINAEYSVPFTWCGMEWVVHTEQTSYAAVDSVTGMLAHRFETLSTPCGARIRVVADAGNDVSGVLIGNTNTPHFPLYAGLSIDLACSDLHNLYYQFQHAGDKIYYITTA